MATLTKVQPGSAVVYATAAGGGDKFLNDGHSTLHVRNGGGSPITVTIDSQKPCDQGFDHDQVSTVNAASDKILGPFSQLRFNDGSDFVNVSYSGVTSVTVAVLGA